MPLLVKSLYLGKNPIEQQEIVIIGGGLMGSATAWHLSNAGKKVLLLEKQDTIYNSGSSNGEARIARSSNRGDDIWSYLHNLSVREVKVLIDFLNNSTATERYSMSDIYTTTPVSKRSIIKWLLRPQEVRPCLVSIYQKVFYYNGNTINILAPSIPNN